MQNRSKLIELFIGNISNAIVHKILEKAITQEEITNKYQKETRNSWEIAKIYREKINPKQTSLPDKDLSSIRNKIINNVKSELLLRISKGYSNIDLSLIKLFVDEALKELRVS